MLCLVGVFCLKQVSLFCFHQSILSLYRRSLITLPYPPSHFLLSGFSLYPCFTSYCEHCIYSLTFNFTICFPCNNCILYYLFISHYYLPLNIKSQETAVETRILQSIVHPTGMLQMKESRQSSSNPVR